MKLLFKLNDAMKQLCIMLLLLTSVSAIAQTGSNVESEFLTVNQAFPFSSQVLSAEDGDKLVLTFATEQGYYLYHKRFSFQVTNGNVSLAEPQFSVIAEQKQDPNFGLVKVYHQPLTVTLPFTGSGSVKVRYQGCADSGLCYLPQRKVIELDAKVTVTSANDSQSLASMLAGAGRAHPIRAARR